MKVWYDAFLRHAPPSEENHDKLMKQFASALRNTDFDRTIVLSKIIALFASSLTPEKKGKDTYIRQKILTVNSSSASAVATTEGFTVTPGCRPYRLQREVCQYGVNETGMLPLFQPLTRQKVKQEYIYKHWLYFASFSPIWYNRISDHQGIIDHNDNSINFQDEIKESAFEMKYNLDPEEQPLYIKERTLPNVDFLEADNSCTRKYNWEWFCDNMNRNGLLRCNLEELHELDCLGLQG